MATHDEHRPNHLLNLRHTVEILAFVAAGIWAVFVFVYQQQIQPILETPSEQVSVTWDRGTVVRGVRVAVLHVELENTGHAPTDVASEAVDVSGFRYTTDPAPPASISAKDVDDDRTVAKSKPVLILAHARLRDAAEGGEHNGHIELSPGQHSTIDIPVAVREGRFDVLRAFVEFVITRYRRGRHGYISTSIVRTSDGQAQLSVSDKDGYEDDDTVDVAL